MFQQYVAILNLLQGRGMIDLAPPEELQSDSAVSKTLAQHPLVLLDQQLQSLVKEEGDAIIHRQPPGRR
jgi:hypothetical protein